MRPDPEAIAAATLASPSVARLFPGVAGEIASYLPGRQVPGVRIRSDAVEIHVTVRWGGFLPAVGEEVRASVAPLSGTLPVFVFVDDVQTPDESPESQAALPSSGASKSSSAQATPKRRRRIPSQEAPR
jgi:hypothetical protein